MVVYAERPKSGFYRYYKAICEECGAYHYYRKLINWQKPKSYKHKCSKINGKLSKKNCQVALDEVLKQEDNMNNQRKKLLKKLKKKKEKFDKDEIEDFVVDSKAYEKFLKKLFGLKKIDGK